jgi:hypothetical protein
MASLESAAVVSLDRDEFRKPSNGDDSSVNGIPGTPTIRVTVVQSGRAPKFNIVERTTWKGGAWNEHDSTRHNLTMTGTDVSGILRFKSEGAQPEFFLVALGVDSDRWCDLKVDLKSDDVAVLIHQLYYTLGTEEFKTKMRHLGKVHKTTKKGTDITVEYYFNEVLAVKEPGVFDEGVKEPRKIDFVRLLAVKITIT